MDLFFLSRSFIKRASLMGIASILGCPYIVNAEVKAGNNAVSIVQQAVEVKGVVYDSTGFPVIGASVVEKGNSTNGAITDMDGNFTLNVAKDAIIVISYIGCETQEIKVTPGKILNVTLKEDNQVLDEVVVVGYGVQKKVNLTGSVATVEGDVLVHKVCKVWYQDCILIILMLVVRVLLLLCSCVVKEIYQVMQLHTYW